jgi:hypothetical protein
MENQLNAIAEDASQVLISRVTHQPIPDGKGGFVKVVTNEAVAHARLKIDTRKWVMSKLKPYKYGERTTISGDPDAPLMGEKPDLSKLSNEELKLYIALQSKVEKKK